MRILCLLLHKAVLQPVVFFILLMTFCVAKPVQAQLLKDTTYQQGYYQWPINAAKGLAANFGELRPNHYHMGLDCRSDQAVNKQVFAAADGYVTKIKVESYGFGQAIYINHPNGTTTLYAHLNSFYPALEKYVRDQQYKLKSWAVYLDIPANMFPVKKGQEIAKSGNTGGSMGPHLHFEVRDTKTDKVINPLLLGFPLQDNIAPDVLRLAVYDRCLSTYEQTPKIYALKKVNGVYSPVGGNITVTTEKVSFAITAWDRYTGSTNQNGIFEATMFDNGKAVSAFRLTNIGYDETRYLNANIDYKTKAGGGPWLQHLSKLPGYNTGVYVTDESNGVVTLEAGDPHSIKIVVGDANNNYSTVAFSVKMNTIIEKNNRDNLDAAREFHPGFVNVFESDNVHFYLPEKALYDSFTFTYKEMPGVAGNNIYMLHKPIVPLQQYFPVSIRGKFAMTDTGKVVMKRSYGTKSDYSKAVYRDGFFTASFREFGNFQLLLDTSPPVITSIGLVNNMNASKLSRIVFKVTDDSEDLADFTALLDGQWLRFTNDKATNFIYTFDEYCPPGEHDLKITATDMAGNITEKNYHFTR